MRLLLVATVLIVAGCGAAQAAPPPTPTPTPIVIVVTPVPASPGPPASQPAPSASAAASPTPSFLTIKQAASAYYQLAKAVNAAGRRADMLYGGSTSLRGYRAYWAIIAKADDKFIDGLKKVAWPPEVQADIPSSDQGRHRVPATR